ncbi:hypothetical protein ACE38F_12050 [Bacillus mycoides]|uniref:hypothetical protein n=1 Tax=Bacillus mycoides TaxID=1405 RepID=UPI0035C972C2
MNNKNIRNLLNRKIKGDLTSTLFKFINAVKKQENKSVEWELFYLFIIESYATPRLNRYSVSQLGLILKEEGLQPSIYIKPYAHGLFILALKDGKKIYGNHFNI